MIQRLTIWLTKDFLFHCLQQFSESDTFLFHTFFLVTVKYFPETLHALLLAIAGAPLLGNEQSVEQLYEVHTTLSA